MRAESIVLLQEKKVLREKNENCEFDEYVNLTLLETMSSFWHRVKRRILHLFLSRKLATAERRPSIDVGMTITFQIFVLVNWQQTIIALVFQKKLFCQKVQFQFCWLKEFWEKSRVCNKKSFDFFDYQIEFGGKKIASSEIWKFVSSGFFKFEPRAPHRFRSSLLILSYQGWAGRWGDPQRSMTIDEFVSGRLWAHQQQAGLLKKRGGGLIIGEICPENKTDDASWLRKCWDHTALVSNNFYSAGK